MHFSSLDFFNSRVSALHSSGRWQLANVQGHRAKFVWILSTEYQIHTSDRDKEVETLPPGDSASSVVTEQQIWSCHWAMLLDGGGSLCHSERAHTCQFFFHTFDGAVEISSSVDKLMHAVTAGFFEVDCPCCCESTSFLTGSFRLVAY